ncbi:MAG: cation:proton antiporter [Planctomycetota bacterium]
MPLTLASSAGDLLLPLVVILAAAGLVAVVLQKLRLATVPAYLITGSIIGPHALGLINDPEGVSQLSGLAMVFLLFGIGLHIDLSTIRVGLTRILAAGLISLAISIALMIPTAAVLQQQGWPMLAAAMALALSSTAVVMQVLQARRRTERVAGRLSLGVLLLQDLAAVAMLIALPVLAAWHTPGGETSTEPAMSAGDMAMSVVWAVLACGGIVATGRLVLPLLLRQAARQRSAEVMTVISAAFAIGAAAATEHTGLSAELGAFLAGFLLATTPFRHHLSGQMGVIRDLFLAIFFTTLGTAIDYAVLAEYWLPVVIASVLVIALKTLAIGGAAYIAGTTGGTAIAVGLSLAQGGEFSLVVVAAAQGAGLLDTDAVSKLTGVIVVTLVLAPALIDFAFWITEKFPVPRTARWVHSLSLVDVEEREAEAEADPKLDAPSIYVIVAGMGVVGRAVIDSLRAIDRPVGVSIVEMNPSTVRTQQQRGHTIIYGDVANPDVLESAGIRRAQVLVLSIPDDEAVLRAVREAKRLNPSVQVIARTSFLSRAMVAHRLGAVATVVEEMAAAREMDRAVTTILERACADLRTAATNENKPQGAPPQDAENYDAVPSEPRA